MRRSASTKGPLSLGSADACRYNRSIRFGASAVMSAFRSRGRWPLSGGLPSAQLTGKGGKRKSGTLHRQDVKSRSTLVPVANMMGLIALGDYMRPSAFALLLAFIATPSMAIAESSPFLKTISSLPPQWKQAKDWECLQRSGHFVQSTSALPAGRSEDFRRTGEYYLETRINIKDGYIFSQTHGGTDSLLMEDKITEVSYAKDYNYIYNT